MKNIFDTGSEFNKIYPPLDEIFSEDIEMQELLDNANLDHVRLEIFAGFDAPKSLSKEDLWEYGFRYQPKLKHLCTTPKAHHANEYFYIKEGNTEDVINPQGTPFHDMVQEIKL